MNLQLALFLSLVAIVINPQTICAAPPRTHSTNFENQFLKIKILPGWTVGPDSDEELHLTHGKYLLLINPIFTHATGADGGSLGEITQGMPSVDAFMPDREEFYECTWNGRSKIVVSDTITLQNLFSGRPHHDGDYGCIFPKGFRSVWFGAYFSGERRESHGEYTITLSYATTDVNKLPRRGSSKLKPVFAEVAAMLKTLELKSPIIITDVEPQPVFPGTTVKISGTGFTIHNEKPTVRISERPYTFVPNLVVATDGKSLTFEVPTSIEVRSCQARYVDLNEGCVPVPANHVDADDCPPQPDGSINSCGKPLPPATYHLVVAARSCCVRSDSVFFTVASPAPTAVSISLVYPNQLVYEHDEIVIKGQGFTATDNTVQIGPSIVTNLSSPDGKTLKFLAPRRLPTGFLSGNPIRGASVSNANGQSNSVTFRYGPL